MNINKVFSYQFEDKQWISKLGIGAVITFVPVLNFALSGYIVGIIRNVMQDSVEPLPNWDDLGKKLTDGLILFAAGLIYALPLIIIFLPLGMLAVSSFLSGNHNLQDMGRLVAGAGSVLLFCLSCFIIIYVLALSVVYPAILVMFARQGTFSSCFKFRELYEMITRNAGPYFTAWIVYFGAALVLGAVLGFINIIVAWIPCIGWIASFVISMASTIYLVTVYAHLFGQFSAIALKGNQPLG
jgi:hypothetical protein